MKRTLSQAFGPGTLTDVQILIAIGLSILMTIYFVGLLLNVLDHHGAAIWVDGAAIAVPH